MVLGLVALLVSPIVPPAVAGSSPAVSLTLTPPAVTFGRSQTPSGTIMADVPCAAGRTVDLQQEAAGTSVWTAVGSPATSDGSGGFTFGARQPTANASYRAVVEPVVVGATTCDQLTSPAKPGKVRAAVTFALGRTSVPAGSCTTATATVKPAKSGTHVLLQERGSSAWRTVRTLTLDASSRAATQLCETWPDLGRHTMRMTWPSQDDQNATGSSPARVLAVPKAAWMRRIDRLAGGHAMGISIRAKGHMLYEREAFQRFAPASNEKLLLSMALLDRIGPSARIETDAAAGSVHHGVVSGNLWILGHGDPSTGPGQLRTLAKDVVAAGVRRITGRVMGSTTYFSHDWYAPGWRKFFPRLEVGLPSALTFKENHVNGRNVHDPERYAAQELARKLKARGVAIGGGAPGSGAAPGGLGKVAAVRSIRLTGLLRHMDRLSDNFYAEVLGKGLGVDASGPPGTIAHGAAAIESWAAAHGTNVSVHDSSGLSYRNRVTPNGLTGLLQYALGTSWAPKLLAALPAAGQGTLKDRHLAGVKLRAKTGTLDYISALSGWVWLSQLHDWAEFSILDRGMGASHAKDLEDAIVRTTASSAH